MKPAAVATLAVLLVLVSAANAQVGEVTSFGSKNTYSALIEYANDSSRIVLGRSPNRKFASLGFQYEHRLVSNSALQLRYAAEVRPLILESDPISTVTNMQTSPPPVQVFVGPPQSVLKCVPGVQNYSYFNPLSGVTSSGRYTFTCSHRLTYAQGLSPFGGRINLLPHRRFQPTASLLAGYMLSAKKIPIESAGSFNFTFEFGAGLEYFLSPSRSMRVEYQIQHFSNAYTAQQNPGVDSGLFKLSYSFGR
jgi:opacity protein-like surface antigen